MTSAYPDIEGQLYTTGAPDAAYTEAEARQRAADRREVEAAAGAAGASALVNSKAYTDQKVSPLATTVAMNAADALTLSNAKAYTDTKVTGLATTAAMQAGDQKSLSDAKAYTDEQVAGLDLGSGVGSRLVSGGVEFSAEDESLPPFVVATTGGAVVEGVTLTAGQMAAFWFLSGEWHVMVHGQDAVWRSTVKPDTRIAVTPAAPTFTDDTENGGGTWETATQPGVQFSPASGTADPGQEVTVTATVSDTEQYKFTDGATTSWTFRFSSGPATSVSAIAPVFTPDSVLGGGRWTTVPVTGVVYSPESGTATPGQTVTVTASAAPGYTLDGVREFSYTFPQGVNTADLLSPSVAYTPSSAEAGASAGELTWGPSVGSGPTLTLGHVSDGTPAASLADGGVKIVANSYLEGAYSIPQPNTVIVLAKSTGSHEVRLVGSTPSNSIFIGTQGGIEVIAGKVAKFTVGQWAANTYIAAGGVFNGANSYAVSDGTVAGPADAGTNGREFIRLNSDTNKTTSRNFDTTYKAVLIWERALTTAELEQVTTALMGVA